MNKFFDGRKIRDEILRDLANKVVKMKRKPAMAVFLIGDNPVCQQYVELKKKLAEKTGINFCLYKFDDHDSEEDISSAIEFLNQDDETDGVMIQIPIAEKFDQKKLIAKISPEKDIDGLRFCSGLDSKYKPPVVLSILEAIKRSGVDSKNSKIAVLGRGFLVGAPLIKALEELKIKCTVILNSNENRSDIVDADIVISATGRPGVIKEDMVKEGVVLIDAGTAEENGQLIGDIDPKAYKKSVYHTPVPGGIGPVTVAMLFKNLVD